jgi:hypothetical protein
MSMSIEELDATVRNFYEGRGEAVPCPTLVVQNLVTNIMTLAKTSSKCFESGSMALHFAMTSLTRL